MDNRRPYRFLRLRQIGGVFSRAAIMNTVM